MKNLINRSTVTWQLILLTVFGVFVFQVHAQTLPKAAFVNSRADVVNNCVTNVVDGGQAQQLSSPMVPLKAGPNPDLYMVTINRYTDGRVLRLLIVTFDRKDKFADYKEVIIKDGKTIPVEPASQMEGAGRKVRSYTIAISEPTYQKWMQDGVEVTFKGMSGSLPLTVPAFVFAATEEQSKALAGNTTKPAVVAAAPNPPVVPPATTPAPPPATTPVPLDPVKPTTPAMTESKPSAPAPVPSPAVKDPTIPDKPQVANISNDKPAAAKPSPYLRSGSIGVEAKPAAQATTWQSEFSLPDLKPEELASQEYIFMPMCKIHKERAYSLEAFDKYFFSSVPLDYDTHVGQTLQVLKTYPFEEFVRQQVKEEDKAKVQIAAMVHKKDSVAEVKDIATGKTYFVLAKSDGLEVKGIALKRDLDFAASKYKNKKVWLNTQKVYTFDEATDTIEEHTVPKWQPVDIIDVVLGSALAPARVIFKDAKGKVYFQDVQVSSMPSSAKDYEGQVGGGQYFLECFLIQDPARKYAWPQDIMQSVTNGKIKVGMTPEQVIAAWGYAQSTNKYLIGNRSAQQWIYYSSQVIFEDGKCISIIGK